MKVRFYWHNRDFDGTIIEVKTITFYGGRGGKVVTKENEEVFDCPTRFVIEETCNMEYVNGNVLKIWDA